jgi:hypothetical protein
MLVGFMARQKRSVKRQVVGMICFLSVPVTTPVLL